MEPKALNTKIRTSLTIFDLQKNGKTKDCTTYNTLSFTTMAQWGFLNKSIQYNNATIMSTFTYNHVLGTFTYNQPIAWLHKADVLGTFTINQLLGCIRQGLASLVASLVKN